MINLERGDGSLLISPGAGMMMYAIDQLPEASYALDMGGMLSAESFTRWIYGVPHFVPRVFFVGTVSLASSMVKFDALRNACGDKLYAYSQNHMAQNHPTIAGMRAYALRHAPIDPQLLQPRENSVLDMLYQRRSTYSG